MGRIEIWTGLPGSGRRAEAIQKVLHASSELRRTWWITSTLRSMDDVTSQLLHFSNGAFVGIEVMTCGMLPKRIFGQSGELENFLDNVTNSIVLRESVYKLNDEQLVFAAESPGWISRIVDIFDRIAIGELRWNSIPSKLAWLKSIYAKHEKALKDSGYKTEAFHSRAAIENLEVLPNNPVDLIIIERLGPQTPHLVRLLHKLAGTVSQTIVIVDHLSKSGQGLSIAENDYSNWFNLEGSTRRDFEVAQSAELIARNLFPSARENQSGNSEELTVKYDLDVSDYPDMASEVRSVAARVAHLVRTENVDPKNIGIVATNLDNYTDSISEIFPYYGLLADIRIGKPLTQTAFARLILQLLEIRIFGFRREDVTEALLNPLMEWDAPLDTEKNVLRFDSAARCAFITGGNSNIEKSWIDPFQKRIVRLKETPDYSGDTDEEAETIVTRRLWRVREATWLEKALASFKGFVTLILEIDDKCSIDEVGVWLKKIFAHIKLNEKLESRSGTDLYLIENEAIRRIASIMDQVRLALEIADSGKISLQRIFDSLRSLIQENRLQPVSRIRGGIRISGPLDIRGIKTEHLFFLGFTANLFPRKPEIDILTPFGINWRNGVDRIAEDKALLLEAMLSSKSVHISLPVPLYGEGKEAPSPFLNDLRSAGIKLKQVPEDDKIYYSAYKFLKHSGRSLGDANTRSLGFKMLSSAAFMENGEIENTKWYRAAVSAQVELIRQNPASLSRYEGWMEKETINKILQARSTARPFSASSLELYAACPMQFLLKRIFVLDELEDVEEEADPAKHGTMVHQILAESARRLRQPGGLSLSFSDESSEILDTIEDVTQEIIREYPYDNLFWDRRIRELTVGLRNPGEGTGILRLILDFESVKTCKNERIAFAEASFGGSGENDEEILFKETLDLELDGVKVSLQGRIDRISLHPEKGWRIWDYKFTKYSPSSAAKIKNGTNFQIPVYTMALEKYLLESSRTGQIDFSSIYQIKSGDRISESSKWKSSVHQEEKDGIVERIINIRRGMESGRFHHPLSQHNDLCNADLEHNYCPYKYICRRDPKIFQQREKYLKPEYVNNVYKLAFQDFESLSGEADGNG
ncbi:PD-(D/E)XK nuclease family protein [Calditrichota bacterium]